MIKPFDYKHHSIHNAHSFVNYVFLEVILKAPKIAAKNFSSELVIPKYKEIIDKVNSKYIKDPLSKTFVICKNLNIDSIKILRRAVINNNRIRLLCKGEIKPVLYGEINLIDVNLGNQIKIFCDYLYNESIKKAPFYNKYGKITDYYKILVSNSVTCRACGRPTLLSKYHSKRSAFDHYFPRIHYPFSAINFKNLIPMCDICNESYKNQEDPILVIENKGKSTEIRTKTKAYYPFSRFTLDISLDLKLKKPYNKTIGPNDMDLSFVCVTHQEETDNWNRLFGIEENYKAEFCSDEMYSYYEEYLMAKSRGSDYIDLLSYQDKFVEKRFLKIPFLNAVK